jgi:N-acetylmuramoyl-L-alanine amidase
MTVSDKFKELAKIYSKATIEFPNLKAVTLAQWILESGRGTSVLFKDYHNAAGMKWREEMAPFGKPVKYGAHDGDDTYVFFNSLEDFTKGYWRFIDRSPYAGWREHAGNPEAYITFLKKCGYAEDPNYVSKVISLIPEATELLKEYASAPATVGWFKRLRDSSGTTVIVACAGGDAVEKCTSDEIVTQRKFEDKWFPATAGTSKTAPAGETIPDVPEYTTAEKPEPKPDPTPATGKRVLLDPGHSESHTGARGKNSSVQEEDLNRFQAELMKAELALLGVQADIIDPLDDDLFAIGAASKGYDAFLSLHLNAYANKEFYTCTMCHPSRQTPGSKSAKVASEFAQAVAAAIGNPCFSGTAGWPKGVMATGLSVLSGAASVNCPIFFLSELEFIDDETTDAGIKERIKKGIKAGAAVLAKALGTSEPQPATTPYLKVVRTGAKDANGLEKLKLTLEGTDVPAWDVRSGARGCQHFLKGGTGELPGTLYPAPQGEYSVENIKWAGGKDNWNASHGPGLGPVFVPFEPKFSTERGSFGFHLDENLATSPGSAGCMVFSTLAETKRFVEMLLKYDPKKFSVQWGL